MPARRVATSPPDLSAALPHEAPLLRRHLRHTGDTAAPAHFAGGWLQNSLELSRTKLWLPLAMHPRGIARSPRRRHLLDEPRIDHQLRPQAQRPGEL
jgi:hypothetical protein